jgi:hypothetical protein
VRESDDRMTVYILCVRNDPVVAMWRRWTPYSMGKPYKRN